MNEETKSAIRSKTMWLGWLQLAVGIVALVAGSDVIKNHPQVAGIFATVAGVLTLVLRLVTKVPIDTSGIVGDEPSSGRGLVLVLACMAVASPALASDPIRVEYQVKEPAPYYNFSLAGNYSFERETWSVVALSQVDNLWRDPFGLRGASVDLKAMVGGDKDVIIAGGAIQLSVPVHERIRFGVGLSLTKNQPTLDEFFKDFKGFEFGAVGSIEYQLRFNT